MKGGDDIQTLTTMGPKRREASTKTPTATLLYLLRFHSCSHLFEEEDFTFTTLSDLEAMDSGTLRLKSSAKKPKRGPGRPPSVNKYVFLTVRLYYEIIHDLPADLANKDTALRLGLSERPVRKIIEFIRTTDDARLVKTNLEFCKCYSLEGQRRLIEVLFGLRIWYILFKSS